MSSSDVKLKIGEVLIRRGQVKPHQVEFLLGLQRHYKAHNRNVLIGDLLSDHRVVTQLALTEALAAQEEMPRESITLIIDAMKDFPSAITKIIGDEKSHA